jgi:hypothetical protein
MARRLLLVEGKDDEHVVRHLCQAHGIEPDFQIEQPAGGGIEQLLDQVPIRLKASDVERLGVVVDADENVQSRWEQLRDRLRNAGYDNVPDSPEASGTIIDVADEFRSVRLGVWIMPDNLLPGMLENFLAFLVPENDKMLPRVDRFLGSLPVEERLFSDAHLPKARIHTYLAVQKEPGKPLGLAITFKYLDASREAVAPFVEWIRNVLTADGT